MAEVVHIGVWTNYKTNTLTLTLTQDVGSLLTAALALFVSVAMGHLWSIVCFFIHQIRSTPHPRSGLHHQRQALLRNTTTAASTAWTLTMLAWTWRGKSRGVVRGTAALVTVSLLFVALVAATSLYSSRIQILDGDVLLTGRGCGRLPPTLGGQDGKWEEVGAQANIALKKWKYDRATEYGQNCYGPAAPDGQEPNVCRDFPLTRVPISIRVNVSCPFGGGICAQANGAMTMDTGLIDSNDHLGVNAPPGDRIKYQRVLTCAPIKTGNYSSPWMANPPAGEALKEAGVFYKTYNFGPDSSANYTFLSSNKTTDTPYYLFTTTSRASERGNSTNGTWRPIPQLDVKDADITLVILRNEVVYQTPVKDPWFRASTFVSAAIPGLGDEHYVADELPASFIACAEKHRVCSSNTSCTPFGGLSVKAATPVSTGVDDFGNYDARATGVQLNRQQMAAHELLRQDYFGTLQSFLNRGMRQLRALDFITYRIGQVGVTVQTSLSNPLPENQWQLELASMFNITVASMQVAASQFAAPPDLPVLASDGSDAAYRLSELIRRPVDDDESVILCSRTRTRSPHHANFAFIPLVATLAAGLAVILANLCCVPCAFFWPQRKLGRGQRRRREWQQDHMFMLQKAKLEAEGIGPWEVDEGGDIPWVTPTSRERLPLVQSETAYRAGPQLAATSDTFSHSRKSTDIMGNSKLKHLG